MADTDKLVNEVKTMTLQNGESTAPNNSNDDFMNDWGFPLPDLYKLSLRFYKGTTNGSGKHDFPSLFLSLKVAGGIILWNKQWTYYLYFS